MRYTPIDLKSLELKKFKDNAAAVQAYRDGINLLRASGLFHLLRAFSSPNSPDAGANVYQSAYLCAHTEGFNKCLEDIEHFEIKYLTEMANGKAVVADFGGRKALRMRGDLVEVNDGNEKS